MTKLFIAGLPFGVNDDELRICFEQYGAVERAHVVRGEQRRSRGFAFVTMIDPLAAKAAIAELNGGDWGGRYLEVREAER